AEPREDRREGERHEHARRETRRFAGREQRARAAHRLLGLAIALLGREGEALAEREVRGEELVTGVLLRGAQHRAGLVAAPTLRQREGQHRERRRAERRRQVARPGELGERRERDVELAQRERVLAEAELAV